MKLNLNYKVIGTFVLILVVLPLMTQLLGVSSLISPEIDYMLSPIRIDYLIIYIICGMIATALTIKWKNFNLPSVIVGSLLGMIIMPSDALFVNTTNIGLWLRIVYIIIGYVIIVSMYRNKQVPN